MGLNRQLRNSIKAGLRGDHTDAVNRLGHRLPNFIIIGAAKSATTTLSTILPLHPDIFLSHPKEPKFFGRRYDKGWDWYGRLFKNGCQHKLRGEASTMYASSLKSFVHAPALMHRYIPGLKLVYIARDPLERIVSQWRHRKGRQPKTPDFSLISKSRHLRRLIVGCSLYNEQLQRFLAYYPESQIHCLLFEDLIRNPRRELFDLLAFLDADNSDKVLDSLLDDGALPRVNEAGDKGRSMVKIPEWTPKLRKEVLNTVGKDAIKFLNRLGKPLDTWDLQQD